MGKNRKFFGSKGGPTPKKMGAKKTAQSAAQMSQMALSMAEQIGHAFNGLSHQTNQRLASNEQAIINLVDTNAIMLREVGRALELDWDKLGAWQMELNLVKDFSALTGYIAKHLDADSPILIFNEMSKIVQNKPVEKTANFALVFNLAEMEGITLTMHTDGSVTFVDELKAFTEEETFSGFLVDPRIFQDWILNRLSVEVLFMKDQLSTEDLNGVAAWLSNLNFSAYVKAVEEEKAAQQEKERAKEENPDRMEITPEDFAVEGHPEGARIFGGDFATLDGDGEEQPPATDQQTEGEEQPPA